MSEHDEAPQVSTKGGFKEKHSPASNLGESSVTLSVMARGQANESESIRLARRAAMASGRHPSNYQPAPCGGCADPQPVPSWFHTCDQAGEARRTTRDDYRTLVALNGEEFDRPLHDHEVVDLMIAFRDTDDWTGEPLPAETYSRRGVPLDIADIADGTCSVEPTDDLGMVRTYWTKDGAELMTGGRVTGAVARKWAI